MTERPKLTLTGVVLDTTDPDRLATFYTELLGWRRRTDEPEWITLEPTGGGAGLSFQLEDQHKPPVWPAGADGVQMQVHLDIEVEDLAAAGEFAAGLGAELADFQPQEEVRVYLDPAGHPFCLFT